MGMLRAVLSSHEDWIGCRGPAHGLMWQGLSRLDGTGPAVRASPSQSHLNASQRICQILAVYPCKSVGRKRTVVGLGGLVHAFSTPFRILNSTTLDPSAIDIRIRQYLRAVQRDREGFGERSFLGCLPNIGIGYFSLSAFRVKQKAPRSREPAVNCS